MSKLDFIERNELNKNLKGFKALYKMNELNETEKKKTLASARRDFGWMFIKFCPRASYQK